MTAMATACDDLDWLRENGALAGVAEIIRERRRQIETKSFSVAHDRVHHDRGTLVNRVASEASVAFSGMTYGIYGPPEVERQMAKAGALAAAEIDRLDAEFTPVRAVHSDTPEGFTDQGTLIVSVPVHVAQLGPARLAEWMRSDEGQAAILAAKAAKGNDDA